MPIKLQQQAAKLDTLLSKQLHGIERVLLADFSVLLAGGAVRKSLLNEDLGSSDIDVFFKSSEDWLAASTYLSSLGCKVRKHANCHGVKLLKSHHSLGTTEGLYIQLITKECYPNMAELMSKFDFTVCQFGYSNGIYYYPEQALNDEKSKQLRYEPLNTQKPNVTRYIKYIALGYTPSVETFETIFIRGRDSLNAASEEISDSSGLYSGI